MVCLVIRGDLNSIDAIDSKIQREIPVIILKGSGAVSDIIAFANDELNEKYTFNFTYFLVNSKIILARIQITKIVI